MTSYAQGPRGRLTSARGRQRPNILSLEGYTNRESNRILPERGMQRWDGSTKVDSFVHNTSIEQGGIEVVGPSSPPKRMPSASGAGNNGRGSGVRMGVGWWGTNVRQHGNKDALREETLTPTTPCMAVGKRPHPMSHPSPDFSASSLVLVPDMHLGGGRVNYLRAPGNALRRKGMAALAHTSQQANIELCDQACDQLCAFEISLVEAELACDSVREGLQVRGEGRNGFTGGGSRGANKIGARAIRMGASFSESRAACASGRGALSVIVMESTPVEVFEALSPSPPLRSGAQPTKKTFVGNWVDEKW
eukprot:CAMPEP_0179406022 /NCGR_PEP_ID=MMETSP0799-20121207/636_1 /TAXON_ID=46947 /ORGANISM="Geminigera cryophila, Strain CCMP2564" /LENGTH=305 /DNA_ID=CAMNT_0021176985 /DNA_START=380 /DNA_END=1294 /DNA_ORIENTATION=+